jgi:putative FmdB family regulatory protein
MPMYEYRCRACGRAFERLVTGGTVVTCPACRSADVTRLLSLFGVRTGSGFASSVGGGCGCGAGGCGCH